MVKTYGMIMNDLRSYKSPKTKLGRMVSEGAYIQIVRGLYETDPNTPGYLLAGSIYGPSYLSFDFALAYYGMIPETVAAYTSATFGKHKSKSYSTPFGLFTYRDIPKQAYPLGIILRTEGDYTFQIASREKALCDKLYAMPPIGNQKELMILLEENLRIEHETILSLNIDDLKIMTDKYHSTNIELLYRLMRRIQK